MGWTNDTLDEVTAPGSVPFIPGNDVIGLGTELPPELLATGIRAAIVFYNSGWSILKTVPTTKFQFIATWQDELFFGAGYAVNPSVNPTAIVVFTKDLFTAPVGGVQQVIEDVRNAAVPSQVIRSGASAAFGLNDRYFDPTTGTIVYELQPANVGMSIAWRDPTNAGKISLFWDANALTLGFVADAFNYFQWNAVGLVNGWSATPSPSFGRQSGVQVRRFPDGTVYMRGVATPGINAVGTYIAQLPAAHFYPSKGIIFPTYSAGGNVRLVVDSGNGAITIVNGDLPVTELEFDATWSAL